MPNTLSKISETDLAPHNVSGFKALLVKLAAFCNALLNWKIVLDSNRNYFSITEGNAVLELNIPAAVKQATGVRGDFALFDASANHPNNGLWIGIQRGTVQAGYGISYQGNVSSTPDVFGSSTTYEFPVSEDGVAYLQGTTTNPADGTAPELTGNTIATGESTPNGCQELGSWEIINGRLIITSGAAGIGSQTVLSAGGGLFYWSA